MPTAPPPRSRPAEQENRLLAAATGAERAALLRMAEPVALPRGAVLFRTGEEVRHILFPTAGLVSIIAETPGEAGVEIGLVGREGLVGLNAWLGEPVAQVCAVVQVPGQGVRVEAAGLLLLARSSLSLHRLLQRFTLAALAHAGRNAACNAAHPLEQRAARWLLSVADRVGPGFPITQEFLAAMLGARRPTLNQVLVGLRGAGLVRHMRGRIAVADRAGLEAAACPCYRLLRAGHERLFPGAFR